MIPKIVIIGDITFSYHCKSAIPIEERKVSFEMDSNVLRLVHSTACHFFCKNQKCINKKNIVELQTEYYKASQCKSCEFNKIDWGFFLIIYKLKKEGLLPENFISLCCTCYKLFGEENWSKLMEK